MVRNVGASVDPHDRITDTHIASHLVVHRHHHHHHHHLVFFEVGKSGNPGGGLHREQHESGHGLHLESKSGSGRASTTKQIEGVDGGGDTTTCMYAYLPVCIYPCMRVCIHAYMQVCSWTPALARTRTRARTRRAGWRRLKRSTRLLLFPTGDSSSLARSLHD